MGSQTRTVWLRTNRRACGVLLACTGVLVVAGGLLLLRNGWWTVVGWLFAVIGFFGAAFVLREIIRPRLGCDGTHLLAFVGGWRPIRVPLEFVEVFFLGQGPSKLPRRMGASLENSTIVVRLAEAAKEWHKRDTNVRLAHWCEGYITLRGVWCEPISTETIRRLNGTLVETKRNLNKTGAND
ncbi:hypothetical protein ACFL2H_05060 [Planctomycetota bacterium]